MKSRFSFTVSFLFPILLLLWKSSPKEILIFLSAVLFHEAGHLLALYTFGYKAKKFSFSLSGAAITSDSSFIPYRKEILIYLAGPLGNAVGMLIAFFLLRIDFTKEGMLLFFCNLLLFLFNLLPIRGLDGERALSAYLSLFFEMDRCERYCNTVSNISLTLLFFFSLYLFIFGKNPSLLLLSLTLFLENKKEGSKVLPSEKVHKKSYA